MNNLPLRDLKWERIDGEKLAGIYCEKTESYIFDAVSFCSTPVAEYVIRKDEETGKYVANYGGRNENTYDTIDEAEHWAEHTHYASKMQPYVKPSPTWISVDDRLPNELKTVLIIYEGDLNFKPRKFMALALREGGDWLGIDDMFGGYVFDDEYNADKFNDDLHGFNITHWMPIPEFSEVTK